MPLNFNQSTQIGSEELSEIQADPVVKNYLAGNFSYSTGSVMKPDTTLPGFNVNLPHTTQAPISQGDRFLLQAYLNQPRNTLLTRFLALVYLNRSLGATTGTTRQGDGLKHTILAQYFLSRSADLGMTNSWVQTQIANTQREIGNIVNTSTAITSDENRPAHLYFREAFNWGHEENRYQALDDLLQDFTEVPKNVYTSFALTSVNLWIGGEADSDDPTVLQNFVLGSYFSIYTMTLAKSMETAWLANAANASRFRMAPTLGGFSILQRRWLANLHGELATVNALDNEHRAWRLKQRAFHAFTVGVSFFEEAQNFEEGRAAWLDGAAHCAGLNNDFRTCQNQPRFSHSVTGFLLGTIDFLLKSGDANSAALYLSFPQNTALLPPTISEVFTKDFSTWNLGSSTWDYRAKNMSEIAALYSDFATSPPQIFLKNRNWSNATATCQLCHQAQGLKFTDAEKNTVTLPDPSYATVGNWPAISTTWHGSALPTGVSN